MATLFGPSPAEVLMARQKEQEQMDMLRQQQISQQGSQFGVFAPLYQAGLQFGDIGAQAMRQGLFPQQADPALQKATAIQGVLSKYAGQDMQDSSVLRQISKDLMPIDQDAAIKALTLAKSLVPEKEKFTTVAPGATVLDSSGKPIFTAPDKEDKDLKIRTPSDFAIAGQALGIPVRPEVGGYTKEETQAIEAKLNQTALNKAAATAARLNFEDPKSKIEGIKLVNAELKPYTEKLDGISNAIVLTNNSRSPFDQKGFETIIGDVFGGKVRAQAEIERLRNSGNLGQRLENTFNLFVSGKIGEATKEDQMEVLLTLYEENAKQHDQVAAPFRSALKDQADNVAPLAKNKYQLPKLSNNRQYIPMSVIRTKGIQKGQTLKVGDKQFTYNGDGTVSPVKGQ